MFDVDDDIGTSTFAELSVSSEDEHAIDILFKLSPIHPDGKSLRKWVKHQTMDDMEQFYQRDKKYLAIGELSISCFENSWNKGNLEFLKTNSIKNLHMLWKYLHHLVGEDQESSIPGNPFSILLSDHFCNLTWKEFMTWRLQDSNQNTCSVSNTGY